MTGYANLSDQELPAASAGCAASSDSYAVEREKLLASLNAGGRMVLA